MIKKINEVTWYEADFLNDTAYTGDTFIPVMCSTTGHFSLPLIKRDQKLKIQILFSILNILVIYKQNKTKKNKGCTGRLHILPRKTTEIS